MSTVLSLKHNFYNQLKSGLKDAWALVRSPDSLYLGLKRKWLIPALLVLSLLLVPTVLIPTSDLLLEKLYPPIEKKLFGLIKSTQKDKRLEIRKVQSGYLLWSLAGIGVLVGLVIYAPRIRYSAELEKERLLQSLHEASGFKGPINLEDRYRINEEIGSGAMGVVYSAFDKKLERDVALKELPSVFVRDPDRRERFRREALTLAKLTHSGIVQIYDLLDDGERMILVMELIKGGTLESLIETTAPLSVPEACRMINSICETLEHVHQKGIVHRDLKPANILIDDQHNLKVTDFGLARLLLESGLTLDGSIMGSPNYMSPEQASGRATDFRSDIYALGILFYELLSGEPPFQGEPAAVLLQQVSEPPPALQSRVQTVESAVSDLIAEMLIKDPEQRLSDFQVIRERLKAFCS